MSISDPFNIFKTKLDLFKFGREETVNAIIEITITEILNDRKNNQLLKRLTTEEDITVHFQILFNSLLSTRVYDGLLIIKDWFLHPPSTISARKINDLLRAFFDHVPDSLTNKKTARDVSTYVNNHIKELYDNLNNKRVPYEVEHETFKKLFYTILDLVEKNTDKTIITDLLNFFSQHFLDNNIDMDTVANYLDRYARNVEYIHEDKVWKQLFSYVIQQLLRFNNTETLLKVFYIIKDKIAKQISLWALAAVEIENNVQTTSSLFIKEYNGTNILSIFGDLAFTTQLIPEDVSPHFSILLDFFSHADVTQEWISIFVAYSKFMIQKNPTELPKILIESCLTLLCCKPNVLKELIPTLLAAIEKTDLSYERFAMKWPDFLYSVSSLIQYGYFEPYSQFDNIIEQISARFVNSSQRLAIHTLINYGNDFKEDFEANFLNLTNQNEILQYLITLCISPYFISKSVYIKTVVKSLIPWFIEKLTIPDLNMQIIVLICLMELNKNNISVNNAQILDCLVALSKPGIKSQSISDLASIVLANITTPFVSKIGNDDDAESFILEDRIFSYNPSTKIMIVRTNYGKNSFHITESWNLSSNYDLPKVELSAADIRLKKNQTKMSEIVPENNPIFTVFKYTEDEEVKSEALKILFAMGLANCNSVPKRLEGADFTEYDDVCSPYQFKVLLSSIDINDETIEGEPRKTNMFHIFKSDLGEGFEFASFGLSFETKSFENYDGIGILFINGNQLINEIKTRMPFLIVVAPIMEQGKRLYRIEVHIADTSKANSLIWPANRDMRVVLSEKLSSTIAIIIFSYLMVSMEKSDIAHKMIGRVEERKKAIEKFFI